MPPVKRDSKTRLRKAGREIRGVGFGIGGGQWFTDGQAYFNHTRGGQKSVYSVGGRVGGGDGGKRSSPLVACPPKRTTCRDADRRVGRYDGCIEKGVGRRGAR